MCTEMEFLDINVTKYSSLLLHAIKKLVLLVDFKENHSLLWFSKSLQKNPQKKKNGAYS